MILTTIDQIAGYTIDRYVGLVNSNQVIGVNLIAEWIASITDVIGGTSGAFRRQLDKVYNDVLSSLSAKAVEMRANAIVGVRMDFDEVSAKGKSMFMLTAQGTAVVVSVDRMQIYSKLHELKLYLEDGLLSQGEYERECKHIRENIEDIVAVESKRIEQEKVLHEQMLKEAEDRLIQIQEKNAVNKKKLSSVYKGLMEYEGYKVGEVVEVIDSGEYFCIDCFTKEGDIVCIKGEDVTFYSINEIRPGNF